ncbi:MULTISPECIES: hypothetical protein [Nocardia]|uniref:hypothetical protein n=1 Tax=Nocardia TaxID=1817 RepID=UPI0007A483BA|nr:MULTISPECIES: hypothetical protein [Nocardia]
MRDIADQLAFLAVKLLETGEHPLGNPDWIIEFPDDQGKQTLRRKLTDEFEYLLTNLPEGTIDAQQ